MISFTGSVEGGLLFWESDVFDQGIEEETRPKLQSDPLNKRAQAFVADAALRLRKKRNIAESAVNVFLTMKSLISQCAKTKPDQRDEYLQLYTEFRYQQIVGGMH